MTAPFKPGDRVMWFSDEDEKYTVARCRREPSSGNLKLILDGTDGEWDASFFRLISPAPLADDIAATAAMMRRTAERMIGDEGINDYHGKAITKWANFMEMLAKDLNDNQKGSA